MFLGFQITLLFAEVFRAIAYYNIGYDYIAVYIARALLIASMALFAFYSLSNDDTESGINEYL